MAERRTSEPLEETSAELAFDLGMDTGEDPQGQPKGFELVENVVWDRRGVPSARAGIRRSQAIPAANGAARAFITNGKSVGYVTDSDIHPVATGSAWTTTGVNTTPYPHLRVASRTIATPAHPGTREVVDSANLTMTIAGVPRAVICTVASGSAMAESGSARTSRLELTYADTGEIFYTTADVFPTAATSLRLVTARHVALGRNVFVVATLSHGGANSATMHYVDVNTATLAVTITQFWTAPAVGIPAAWPAGFGGAPFVMLLDVINASTTGTPSDEVIIGYGSAANQVTIARVTTAGVIPATRNIAAGVVGTTLGTVCMSLSLGSATRLAVAWANQDSGTAGTIPVRIIHPTTLADAPGLLKTYTNISFVAGVSVKATGTVTETVRTTFFTTLNVGLSSTYERLDSAGVVLHLGTFPGLVTAKLFTYGGKTCVATTQTSYSSFNAIAPGVMQRSTRVSAIELSATGTAIRTSEIALASYADLAVSLPNLDWTMLSFYFPTTVPDLAGDPTTSILAIPSVIESPGVLGSDIPIDYITETKIVSLSPDTTPVPCTVGAAALVTGSVPRLWDGRLSVPASFAGNPFISYQATVPGATTGQFTLQVMCEYVDGNGQIMYSTVSAPYDLTLSGEDLDMLGIETGSASEPNSAPVRVKLYSTGDLSGPDATVFKLLTTCVTTAEFVLLSENLQLTPPPNGGEETIYTTGDVLESQAVPPISYAWPYRNRIFAIRTDSPESVWFTQEITDPFLPQWNVVQSLRVDNQAGAPTSGASIADKCLIFQRDQIMVINGFGPDQTGNGTFSQPEVAALGVGVDLANRRSVCSIPSGIVFRHSSGFKLIDAGLQVTDIGATIRTTLGTRTVSSTRYLPSLRAAWFFLRDAAGNPEPFFLSLDTDQMRWTVVRTSMSLGAGLGFTDAVETELPSGVSSIRPTPRVYLMTLNALFVYGEGATQDNDGTTNFDVTGKVRTAWFRKDRNAVLRTRSVTLTGTWATSSVLTPGDTNGVVFRTRIQHDIHANRDSLAVDKTYTWDNADLNALPVGPVKLDARMVSQRCQAFQVEVEFSGTKSALLPATLTIDYANTPTRGKAPKAQLPDV